MQPRTLAVAVPAALLCTLLPMTPAVAADDANPAQLEIQRELDALRAEIAAHRAALAAADENWLDDQRVQEIRVLVADVLADADTRSSLQGSGMTAGWDNGFFLAAPDGSYRLATSTPSSCRAASS